jgi:hypothetical protein
MLSSEDLYFLYWLIGVIVVAGIPALWVGGKLVSWSSRRDDFIGRSNWLTPVLVVLIIIAFVTPAFVIAIGIGTPTRGFKQVDKIALEAKANHCFSCMCLHDLNWKKP